MEVIRATFERDVCLLQLNLPQTDRQRTSTKERGRSARKPEENKSSRHNSVTAAVSNGQTTSQALTEVQSKTSDISKQSPSPLHHTFLLGRARFTARPLSALVIFVCCFRDPRGLLSREHDMFRRQTFEV